MKTDQTSTNESHNIINDANGNLTDTESTSSSTTTIPIKPTELSINIKQIPSGPSEPQKNDPTSFSSESIVKTKKFDSSTQNEWQQFQFPGSDDDGSP